MLISAADLSAEYRRAVRAWPFIGQLEQSYRLPRMMLFAVGSRETNLSNEIGDGGHGHGVWQLDDRSHAIPVGFDGNVHVQAVTAGRMLAGLLAAFAHVKDPVTRVRAAMVGYNAGAGTAGYNLAHGLNLDTGTAHDDYSADTYARMTYLERAFPAPPARQSAVEETEMMFVRFPDGKTPNAIYAFDGSCLLWLTPTDYAALGKPAYREIRPARDSNIYKAPVAAGTPDPRK